MKTQINLSCPYDLDRFSGRAELYDLLGEDGVELSFYGEDARGILPPGRVTGLHLNCPPYWLDFYRGDLNACLREYGDEEAVRAAYGGLAPEALVEGYRRGLANAERFGAEYVVFHAGDASIAEMLTGVPRHTDEEVADAAAELLNEVFAGRTEGPRLLIENLWNAGFRFTCPEITARLLEGVRYPRTDLMLDTGHLMHTRTDLVTQEDAVRYVHGMLDLHGPLARRVRGVHLHASLSGRRIAAEHADPPELPASYAERSRLFYEYVFDVDRHLPFTCPGVRELIERIAPDYLTFELISRDLAEHRRLLGEQRAVFGR